MPRPTTVRVLIQTFGKYRWHLLALVVFGFIGALFEGIGINAAIPLMAFLTSGGALPTDFISRTIAALFAVFSISFTFRNLLIFVLALFMMRAVSMVVFGYVRGWVVADFLSSESETVLSRILFASWSFLLRQKLGNLQSTLGRDMQRTSNLLESLSQVIQSFTGFLMYLLVAINISATMTFFTVVGGGMLLLIVRPLLRKTQAAGAAMGKTEKQVAQFLSENIIGMKSLKASGAQTEAFKEGGGLLRTLRTHYIRLALVRSVSTSFFQPFSILFVVVLFSITYRSGSFSFISFAAALYLIQKIFTYLESGQGALHTMQELVPYAENILEMKKVLAENPEVAGTGSKPFAFTNELAFNNVAFGYGQGEQYREVLGGVSFAVPKGATVGLIGPSGAGKTSVADLVLRLFVQHSGSITLDGVSIQDISLGEWRNHLAYVSQDGFLLNATIADNIRFYRTDLTDDEVVAAAKQANIYNFVMTLPDGFDTQVGDRGVMLSGGQRQRVALARALARKPQLLILDEATSALDVESEHLIQHAIDELRGTVTVFVIAHRLSTVQNADHIVVLDHGQVVEQGSPATLGANPNSYFARASGMV
jgi:subfamily B ATP-binding cassette protein MsbA